MTIFIMTFTVTGFNVTILHAAEHLWQLNSDNMFGIFDSVDTVLVFHTFNR